MGRPGEPDFAALVLAAGAATRMGQPKEWLRFGEVTCLDLVLTACAEGGVKKVIVVTRQERKKAVIDHLAGRSEQIEVVVNHSPQEGQSSSLRTALRHLPDETRAFLVFPVDHPLVTATDVGRLCAAYLAADPPADLVVPSFSRRRGHPVVVKSALAPALLAQPAGASARDVLGDPALHTLYVDVDDDRVLTDMDTPEAYARCLARYLERQDGTGTL